jgi:hypothetical protein
MTADHQTLRASGGDGRTSSATHAAASAADTGTTDRTNPSVTK